MTDKDSLLQAAHSLAHNSNYEAAHSLAHNSNYGPLRGVRKHFKVPLTTPQATGPHKLCLLQHGPAPKTQWFGTFENLEIRLRDSNSV